MNNNEEFYHEPSRINTNEDKICAKVSKIIDGKIILIYHDYIGDNLNIAVLITGTICSGKSTISKKVQEELNVKLIHELNVSPNGIFGIKYAIEKNEDKGIVLIEHLEILSFIDDINRHFEKIIIFLLNVSDNILKENLNNRKLQNITGDYLKYDILSLKKDIEEKFQDVNNHEKYILNINVYEDYDLAYDIIIKIEPINNWTC